ncbi:MBL fold metallo-hydrolase [Bacillus sp. AGMB 02131]|uniref:MBL fold metallo-hydrolase n=1 Tax=Peribacillus faecalis TaxID=2772559 RepID=A0A927CTJ7_9BACI|nr:MBL fold metallo-hydrolase [Peribacillus faecalis]MBD3107293.1 MBL fold metallo-hydrolase [Peribacillus faecalis]
MFNISNHGVELIELDTGSPVGGINTYLIFGEKLTLIDTGANLERNWRSLINALKERQLTIFDIEQVLLTHHHVDHVGLLNRILEVNPIPVLGHPNNKPWLLSEKQFVDWHHEFFEGFLRGFGVPAELLGAGKEFFENLQTLSCHNVKLSVELNEGDMIPGLPEWQVIETKGHAQSHISFYRQKDQLLIAGDHIIKHISSNASIEPPLSRNQERVRPLIQYRENLKKCASIPTSTVLTGHGPKVTNLPELVELRLKGIDKRAARIKEIIKQTDKSGFDIVSELFPAKTVNEQLILVIYETAGHLDFLLDREEIEEVERNGITYYRSF